MVGLNSGYEYVNGLLRIWVGLELCKLTIHSNQALENNETTHCNGPRNFQLKT